MRQLIFDLEKDDLGQKRTAKLSFNLSPKQRKEVEAAAKQKRLTPPQLIRLALAESGYITPRRIITDA